MRSVFLLRCVFLLAVSCVASSQCAVGDDTCAGSVGEQAFEDEFDEIQRRCTKSGKSCGLRLEVNELYGRMKNCALDDEVDDDELVFCQRRLQEILILGKCSKGHLLSNPNCKTSMDMLVFEKPVRKDVVRLLSMVQWQKLFVKSVEFPAAKENFHDERFYLQPYRKAHGATNGRVAFGHRVTQEDFENSRFVGGINVSMAHVLLEEDYQLAAKTAADEIGPPDFNAMLLKYQAVAVDFAFSHGSTRDFQRLMQEGLLKDDKKVIKAELLKKPKDPRHELLYKELIK